MPLLDIAVSQPCACFGNSRLTFRSQTHFRNTYLIGNGRRLRLASTLSWKTLCITEKLWKHYTLERSKANSGRFTIKAVATLEIMSVRQTNEGVKGCQNVLRMDLDSIMSNPYDSTTESSSEDSTDVDEMEKLRRMKISKANKGKTPWNKGRKHSPETLQRIKERTRLAMQDPKVKMKLINLGHAQSDETRIKIGLGVRLGWERRREKLMVQETCHHEWQNLIAVAAKRGLSGEEELQWDSFEILSEVLEKEWLESVEQRKNITRIKGNKRAPKSEEQKRKIAEAIAAKWADPEYRNRVCKSKTHGTREGVERRPRRRPSGDGLPGKRSQKKEELGDLSKHETKSPIERIRSKRSKTPLYKDPLASSKLEMLKNIRAQRAASEDKESVAISRARWFIAEAEKAAKALEISAMMNPLAEASLLESRMLIAEANQIIESIELKGQETIPFEKGKTRSENSTSQVPNLENEKGPDAGDLIIAEPIKVNGVKSKSEMLNDFVLPPQVNGNGSMPFPCNMVKTDETLQHMTGSNGHLVEANLNCSPREGLKCNSDNLEGPEKQIKVIKKWVRGRLVEVEEGS